MRMLIPFLLLAGPATAEELRFTLLDRQQLGGWIHQAASTNADRLEKLRELFIAAGCLPKEQPVKRQKLPNLICETEGPADAIIVIGAHYDKVTDSAGVIDNWSGASMLPALYQALKPNEAAPRKHRLLFIGFTEEEKGLIGSRYFVSQIRKEELPFYHAMVNLDCLGLGPLTIWPHHSNKRLAQLLQHVTAATRTQVGGVNLDQVGSADSFPFAERQIPAIDFHSITQDTWPLLHTPKDNESVFRPDDYWASYQLLATYIAYLDQKLAVTPTTPQ
jgi:Zn-dependent M28 family amino/carboxypeptidase